VVSRPLPAKAVAGLLLSGLPPQSARLLRLMLAAL